MIKTYRILTDFISPLMPLWLWWRKTQGKEDAARLRERFGYASKARPQGTLLWLHGASVGEANSVLKLIDLLREHFPHVHILLTTGTVTSATLMEKRLPAGVFHHYVPIDTPDATARFMRHWRPDIALWVESEFWPNLIASARAWECFMGVINARMSERSFRFWSKYPSLIRDMLGSFDFAYAQSEQDAQRLRALGASDVRYAGNLKYDASPLPCNETELLALKTQLGARPVWLAASTHPGEEALVAKAHALLSVGQPGLLTIIVPRHPGRGEDIARELAAYGKVAMRSKQQLPGPDSAFYLADTLGELGLFYRLCEVVFMGGSLARHGGQNPLEPARLGCAIITGPHTHNFLDIYRALDSAKACLRATSAEALAAQAGSLLSSSELRSRMHKAARAWVSSQSGACKRILNDIAPIFEVRRGP